MNEWLKRIREQLTGLWSRWSRTQKVVLFSIIGASILAIILLVALSATPAMVPLISSPVADTDARLQIAAKLDEMQVKYQLRADNEFYVADEQTARFVGGVQPASVSSANVRYVVKPPGRFRTG